MAAESTYFSLSLLCRLYCPTLPPRCHPHFVALSNIRPIQKQSCKLSPGHPRQMSGNEARLILLRTHPFLTFCSWRIGPQNRPHSQRIEGCCQTANIFCLFCHYGIKMGFNRAIEQSLTTSLSVSE